MREIVSLKISMRRLQLSQSRAQVFGLTFARFTLQQATEEITTDHLLVTEEAVRVLDASV